LNLGILGLSEELNGAIIKLLMSKQDSKKRIKKLKKEINRYRYSYHVLDKSLISDAALDSLKHELYKLEQRYPKFITLDSPTQRIGGKSLEKFKKVRHLARMLSIEDVFSEEELSAWEERMKKLLTPKSVKALDYFVELKIDGFGISLVYKNGIFIQGSTRGDGRIGENVTRNLKTIESIPLKLEIHGKMPNKKMEKKTRDLIKNGRIEIRGEVYMSKKAFEKANKQRKKEGLALYANPRNTAAGSIRQLNPKLAASRDLNFLAYNLVTDLGQTTHQEKHQITRALGFKTDQGKSCKDLKEVISFWKEVKKKRGKLPYQIDGVVVNINSNEVFEMLGTIGKTHRANIALKFPAKQATTVVEDIKIQIGRTGALTPVAHLKPVQVGGTTISRATLHNEDEIKRLGVKIGDTVIIQRAGDVIPDIVQVLPRLRTGKERKFHMPKKCLVCGSQIIRLKGEAIHRCSNPLCGAIQRKKLYYFVSKKAFNIVGLGPKKIDQLMDQGLVSSFADIFELKEGDLMPLERFAEKSAKNLIKTIESSKNISFRRFIFALGIRHVGEETAIDLANRFGNLENLKNTEISDLFKVKDTGEIMAESIYNWFHNKKNLGLLKRLDKVGVKIKNAKRPRPSADSGAGKTQSIKLKGKVFVLTGELKSLSREQAKEKIRGLEGDISGSVSKNTDWVVVGKEPGEKLKKAKKIGVKILNEKQFLKMI